MCRLLIILLLLPLHALTQPVSVSVNQPSIRFDIPEVLQKAGVKSVRCIFKDSRGLMWFGTSNGLFRFDGFNLLYRRKQSSDSTSLPDNTITSIAEDKNGDVWVATLKGIARMNPYNLRCKVYSHSNGLLQGSFDYKVHVDDNGKVWSGHNDGLSLFDEKAGRFQHVWQRRHEAGVLLDYVSCITDFDKDTLVLGTFPGIYLMNKKDRGWRFVWVDRTNLNRSPVTAVFMDSRQRLWAGTWGDGFRLYNRATQRFDAVAPGLWDHKKIVTIVGGITETRSDKQSTIWVNGSGGLLRLSMNDSLHQPASLSIYQHEPALDNSLPEDASGVLYADESGNVWMSSANDKGVVKFTPDAAFFRQLPVTLKGTVYEIQPLQLGQKQFYCVSSWYDATAFTVMDDQWNTQKQFSRLPANAIDEASRNVSGIAVDKYRRIWASTLGGLTVMDSSFRVIRHWKRSDDDVTKPRTNAVLISNDTVWVACYKLGIDLYDLQFNKLVHFNDDDGSGLEDNLVWKFYRDKNNTVWVCGNSNLYRFNSNSKTFSAFRLSNGTEGCEPKDIAELPDGNLLIASANGLIYFNVRTEAFEYIRSPLLQREDNIISVTVDAEGNAWYLTQEHLVHYNLTTKRFTLYGAEDGLKAERGMQIVRSFKPGELIIGQRTRVLQFNYSHLDKPVDAPKVLITTLQVNDSAWQFTAPVHNLELKHFQNKLYVEFAGINYTKTDQNQFAYQLEGIDENWIVSNKNFASYANLGPGNYTFKVKAANYAGNWSDEYRIALNIAPPFWRTWWFITLAVLVLGSIFTLMIRYVSQRNLRERILVLQKEQAVEKERTRIASDMHDDLGSGLTKIAILSEVAKKQIGEPENAVRQLESISSSSRELVDSLQDIIWVLNPKNDSLDSLAAYIREYALKFFEPMDVQLKFHYPANMPSVKLPEEVRRNIFLVMKETFNNIAKHANGKNIQVQLSTNNGHIELKVTDDGKGFEATRIPAFSNGLSNMRTRMQQIGGKYEVFSQPGKGTTTKLVIES